MEIELFQQIVEKSPSIVVVTNINGEFVYVNPKFTQTTGYTIDEVVGKKTNILKSGELSREYYEKMWTTLLEGNDWKGEFHNVKKNGELYWISSSISSVKDKNGNILRFIAVQEEITNFKLAQDKINELINAQHLILESIPDGIVIFDAKGLIEYSNKSMQDLALFSASELGNSTINFSELVDSPELVDLILKNIEPAVKSLFEYELNLIPKRGEPFPVKINITELSGKKFLVVIHDVRTEQKNELLMEEFIKILSEQTYITLFRQSKIGPEIYLTDNLGFSKTEKNVLETKVGVYFTTAIGQGGSGNEGLYGPLPFPDNPEYESLIYSCFMEDKENKDPRSHGNSYCLFVVTFPKKFVPYFANRNYLTRIFSEFQKKHNSVQEIKKSYLEELKSDLIK